MWRNGRVIRHEMLVLLGHLIAVANHFCGSQVPRLPMDGIQARCPATSLACLARDLPLLGYDRR
jgi:hypothetical protein